MTAATPQMMAAAWLHDTVEDTDTSFQELCSTFGPTITEYVLYLTDISQPHWGNREIRKLFDMYHLSNSPYNETLLIKCCDLISNTKDIAQHDKGFAKVYLPEKQMFLEQIKPRIGDTPLWRMAYELSTIQIEENDNVKE